MDWSYDFASKGSNKKLKDDEEYDDCDEKRKPTKDGYGCYPYEDGVMRKAGAVVVDGGQRKSSITHYPNVDGSDSYVVRTERVVKVVRPVMTTHYSLKEDHGNNNLGMAKNFLDQFLKEAAMSGAPVQTRTYWGCKPAWADPDNYVEHSQFSPLNMGAVAKFPSWEDTEHQELGRPSTWSSRNDSPHRSMMHPECNSSTTRPNWPSRDNSFPRSLDRHQLSQPNTGSTPNWARQYDFPPRSIEYYEVVGHSNNSSARPNWPSRYNSPPRSPKHFVSNHPNSSSRSNWSARDDSPSKFMTCLESSHYPNSSTRPTWQSQYDSSPKSTYLESSYLNTGVRPNWSSRDDSSPRPTEYPLFSNHNASTKPNWQNRVDSPPRSMTPNSLTTKPSWPGQEDSPDNIENGRDKIINTGLVLNKFDELNLQDSQGTSPLPNERPNWPNRKGHVEYGTNRGISPHKTNKELKPKFNGAQTKNTIDNEEIPYINNKIPYTDSPVEDEDEDEDEDDVSKKSNILGSSTNISNNKASKTKPNYSSGLYKQPNPPPVISTTNDEGNDIKKLIEEAKKTATYDPNPPQQLHYSAYAVPAAPWDYYKPVLDSNEASRKYNGIAVPNAYQTKPKYFISN